MRRETTCCFTGHRPEKMCPDGTESMKKELYRYICMAVMDGYTTFLTGGAKGVDILAGEMVLSLRQTNPSLHLVCVMPHRHFGKYWGDWTRRLNQMLAQADEVLYLEERQHSRVYQQRNEYMVNHSARLIAVYNGEKGGTRNTLAYAKSQLIEVMTIDI